MHLLFILDHRDLVIVSVRKRRCVRHSHGDVLSQVICLIRAKSGQCVDKLTDAWGQVAGARFLDRDRRNDAIIERCRRRRSCSRWIRNGHNRRVLVVGAERVQDDRVDEQGCRRSRRRAALIQRHRSEDRPIADDDPGGGRVTGARVIDHDGSDRAVRVHLRMRLSLDAIGTVWQVEVDRWHGIAAAAAIE